MFWDQDVCIAIEFIIDLNYFLKRIDWLHILSWFVKKLCNKAIALIEQSNRIATVPKFSIDDTIFSPTNIFLKQWQAAIN